MIEHVYKYGYSVLPSLHKLKDEPVFLKNNTFEYLKEKIKAKKNQKCFFEQEMDSKIYEVICNFIHKQTNIDISNFEEMAMNLQEDLAIHRVEEEKDWLACCHVCFPSGWLPEEKIGKSFEQIHLPIPKMNLKSSYSLAKSMVYSGPFVRYVWSPVFERKINFHPSIEKKFFDPSNPIVWVKIERQVTYGFPEIKSALFIIRQEIVESEDVDHKALLKSCSEMSEDQQRYKGISKEFLDWLRLK